MFNYPDGIICKSCTAFCMKRLNERKEMFNFDFKEMNTNGTEGIPEYARSQSSAVNNNIIMEKTYKRVPFDIELAKKIQSGEVKGRIVSDSEHDVRVVCFDKRGSFPIVALINLENGNHEFVCEYNLQGINPTRNMSLFIELPEEAPKHEFKPFDRVLVRNEDTSAWTCAIFSHMRNTATFQYVANGILWKQCIPYEGNEHLVGTTDKPE